jgi:hypothetical protein
VIVVVLAIYFLADLPRIKLFGYRLAPHSRRAPVILIGDEILGKVGGFLLGNLLTSVIAGSALTCGWSPGDPLPAAARAAHRPARPDPGDRLHHRRGGGHPGRAVGVDPGSRSYHRS